MAFNISISCFSFYFLLLSSFSFVCFSLSTVSIAQTSNQTLVCVVTNQSYLQCSSFPLNSIRFPLTDNLRNRKFSGVVSGNGFVCGLRSPLGSNTSNSTLVCWRFSVNGTNMSYKRIYKGLELDEVEAGNSRICGVERVSRRLHCWQTSTDQPKLENVDNIAVGDNFLCGLSQSSGKVSCAEDGIVKEPSGNRYIAIAAGSKQVCAITVDNDVECWGQHTQLPPSEKFSELAVGENRSCGVRWSDGRVLCWGNNNSFSLPQMLKEIYFASIYAKGPIFCGVAKNNYTLYCWGSEDFESGVFVPFQGQDSQVVLPGPCRKECTYGPLSGSESLCSNKLIICDSKRKDGGVAISKNKTWTTRNIAFLVVGCVGTCSLLIVISFLVYKSHCRCRVHDSGRLDDNRIIEEPKLDKRLSSLASLGNPSQLIEFSIEELAQATDCFSVRFRLGIGSFGSVYRAILSDGRHVAIKRAELTNPTCTGTIMRHRREDKDSAFVNELESMSRLNHKNLVRLMGFYEDTEERVLVYEYMENGSLSDHLHNPRFNPLTWQTRLKIALDAARGIHYLHEFVVPPVIHRDIKSSNILLNATWTAKVSDFGLSQMGPTDEEDLSHLSLRAAGTLGYIDPEYYRLQQLTTKSDVYSFGVVLLELLSGYKAIHKNEDENPINVVEYVVPYILKGEIHRALDRRIPPPTPYEIEAVAQLGYLAVDCLIPCGRERPSMAEVVSSLEKTLAVCLAAPKTKTVSRSNTY
ncbi:Serine/threonine-protein kinase-like protein CCR4 [Cardamine amara subsp. amara]|uniref:non-specific serine/threonine protein kinase n=1 Tax=Cardamine amara subsp. amara TaxID=228776 RepID=A0ABD1BAU5_CARAN